MTNERNEGLTVADPHLEVPTGLVAELRDLGTLGKAWTLSVVVFSLARAVVAWPALLRYGVNPWWFLALDVGTSPTYGIGQAMAVKILRNERRPPRESIPWVALVLVSFLAPYAYLLLAAGHLPVYVVGGVIVWVVAFGALGAYRMAREISVEPLAS